MKGFTYGIAGFVLAALLLDESQASAFYASASFTWAVAHISFGWFDDNA